ncbi:MAG: acyltransferase [Acidobacteriota bacterium]
MTHCLIAADVKRGKNVVIQAFTNLYGCEIGDETRIATFVEIQKDVIIGKKCKISSHCFICSGVTIGDHCFIGHGVMFINDNFPRSVNQEGELEREEDWSARFVTTEVGSGAAIGSNATILGGVKIGAGALIGAGAVVTRNVPPGATVAGNPAKVLRRGSRP